MARLALAGAVLAVLPVVAGCGGGAARVGGDQGHARVLTLLDPIDNPAEIARFTQNADRLSHGALRVRIVPSAHLDATDAESAVIRAVEHGRADLAWTGSRAWSGSMRALAAPMLVDSYPLEEHVLGDGVVDGMLGELRPHGLVGLGILPGPLRKPIGLTGRMVAPADFRGRRILQEAATATLPELAAQQRSDDRESAAILCRRGRAVFDTALPADLSALRAAFAPVYRELERDDATRAAIERGSRRSSAARRATGRPAGLPA